MTLNTVLIKNLYYCDHKENLPFKIYDSPISQLCDQAKIKSADMVVNNNKI